MLYPELPIAFPWYDKLEKQNRYNEHTESVCDYQLIGPADALLPFQITKANDGLGPVTWEVFEINSNNLIANLSADLSILGQAVREGKQYLTYYGQKLPGLALSAGYYYSRITFPNGNIQFSEMFHVPENWFYIANDDNTQFLKLSWYNMNDLRPIFYNDRDAQGIPKFKNVLYLDTFIHTSEPEITEDGTRDGYETVIVTFQKLVIPYRITLMIPDFLKKALFAMSMHDVITLRTKGGIREGIIESVKVNSALEAGGALSVVDIIFQSDIAMVKKGCADNMV